MDTCISHVRLEVIVKTLKLIILCSTSCERSTFNNQKTIGVEWKSRLLYRLIDEHRQR